MEFSCFNIVSYNNLSNTDWLCRAAARIAMVRTKFEELKKKMSKEKIQSRDAICFIKLTRPDDIGRPTTRAPPSIMPPKPWSGVAETAFARNAVSEYVGKVSQLLAGKGAAMRGGGAVQRQKIRDSCVAAPSLAVSRTYPAWCLSSVLDREKLRKHTILLSKRQAKNKSAVLFRCPKCSCGPFMFQGLKTHHRNCEGNKAKRSSHSAPDLSSRSAPGRNSRSAPDPSSPSAPEDPSSAVASSEYETVLCDRGMEFAKKKLAGMKNRSKKYVLPPDFSPYVIPPHWSRAAKPDWRDFCLPDFLYFHLPMLLYSRGSRNLERPTCCKCGGGLHAKSWSKPKIIVGCERIGLLIGRRYECSSSKCNATVYNWDEKFMEQLPTYVRADFPFKVFNRFAYSKMFEYGILHACSSGVGFQSLETRLNEVYFPICLNSILATQERDKRRKSYHKRRRLLLQYCTKNSEEYSIAHV